MATGDIEHIIRLAQAGDAAPQTAHQFLALAIVVGEIGPAQIAMMQVIQLDPGFGWNDHELFADTLKRIRAGAWAGSALRRSISEHAQAFEEMADPYLRARAEDLRGLGRRVLLRLQSGMTQRWVYPERCVLVGEEISIARIADVPVGQLAGVSSCTRGSPFSHAAILARTLRIPAVMGLGSVPLEQFGRRRLLVDGDHGLVYIDPAPDVVADLERTFQQQSESADALKALRDLPAQTPDGARVALHANVGVPSDVAAALESGAEGIGLFRTEFSFMVRDSFPSEEDQYQVYREVLESFAPRPVTMRTLDVGGDKGLPYFPIQEDNAFLGWRGIRLTLDNPGIFLTQLRALLRANAGLDNLRIFCRRSVRLGRSMPCVNCLIAPALNA